METEPVLTSVLSPHHLFRFFQKSLCRLSLPLSRLSLPDIQHLQCSPLFSLAHTPRTSVLSVNPLASSFSSSPSTSALAVGERETALGSPPCGHKVHTYTHTPFPQRPGITWTSLSPFPGFPFGRLNPKYPPPDHPGGASSKPIGRKPITHTKVLFSPFFVVSCVPLTHHAHTCIRFLFHSG